MEVYVANWCEVKVCIVSSCGGHLTEVRCLRQLYEQIDYFYVLNDKIILSKDMQDKTYFIAHSERDWRFVINLWEALVIIMRERPTHILSTGAGPVVPFAIIGRMFFRTRVIFIETMTRVNQPSVTGRIMYRLAHKFFYQWKSLKRYYPKGIYGGPLT